MASGTIIQISSTPMLGQRRGRVSTARLWARFKEKRLGFVERAVVVMTAILK